LMESLLNFARVVPTFAPMYGPVVESWAMTQELATVPNTARATRLSLRPAVADFDFFMMSYP